MSAESFYKNRENVILDTFSRMNSDAMRVDFVRTLIYAAYSDGAADMQTQRREIIAREVLANLVASDRCGGLKPREKVQIAIDYAELLIFGLDGKI